MLELPDDLPIRTFRLEARYTTVRLSAHPETQELAEPFSEAHDKLALLEEEQAEVDVRRVESKARVELADDAWDDTVHAFQRRLLELADHDVDSELYRGYFADIPSQVTSMSYAAEILISKELEARLAVDPQPELSAFAERLEQRRLALEAAVQERTRLEVEEAKLDNRVTMAKAILNRLRRILFARLDEMARARGFGSQWCLRFFSGENPDIEALDFDGVESRPPLRRLSESNVEPESED